jgi:trans-aconitate 2-methyltransferase
VTSISRGWDGGAYDRVSEPMERLGLEVLDRLELRGDETVLDAGCGSGRITAAIIERVPHGRVIGVDGSASMIEAARERLRASSPPSAGAAATLDLRVADLVGLELGETVDAVLSTATFHWIADHDALFTSLRRALRPGGRLVAQCGGVGNVAGVHAAAQAAGAAPPFAEHFADWRGPWHFATPADTEPRLRAAGFADVRCWLQERAVVPDEPRDYLRTIVLGAHLERLPADLADAFLDAVLERLAPEPTIDYVRLNIDATAG